MNRRFGVGVTIPKTVFLGTGGGFRANAVCDPRAGICYFCRYKSTSKAILRGTPCDAALLPDLLFDRVQSHRKDGSEDNLDRLRVDVCQDREVVALDPKVDPGDAAEQR